MYCRFCGNQIEDGSSFCKHCGKKQDGGGTAPNGVNRRMLFGIAGGAVLIILVIVIALTLNGGNGSQGPGLSRAASKPESSDGSAGSSDTQTYAGEFTLPDPESFSGGAIAFTHDRESSGVVISSYTLAREDYGLVEEYAELLEEYGLVPREVKPGDEEDSNKEYTNSYGFDYTGEGQPELFPIDGEEMALYIETLSLVSSGDVGMYIIHSPFFQFDGTASPPSTSGAPDAKTAVTTGTDIIPDPALHFKAWGPDEAKLSPDGADYTVSVEFPMDGTEDEAAEPVWEYMELLSEYGLELTGEEQEGDSVFAFYNGAEGTLTVSRYGYSEEPASVALTYHTTGRVLMVHYSAALRLDGTTMPSKAGVTAKVTGKPEATEKPKDTEKPIAGSSNVDKSNVQVPDFGAFTGLDLETINQQNSRQYTRKDYLIKSNEEIVDEYVELLTTKYNFSLRSDKTNIMRVTLLDYIGSGNVTTFDQSKEKAVSVYIWSYHMPDSEIHVTYGKGLEYVDNGDRTTLKVERTEGDDQPAGGDSGDDDGWEPSKTEIKCTKCHGEKEVDCTNCDGKGYKEKIVESPNYSGKGVKRETVREKCYKCSGGKVTCPRCHGTGKQ